MSIKIISILLIITFVSSNFVYPYAGTDNYYLAQSSKLEGITNEWEIISLLLAIYDMYGFREHGRITANEIDSAERIKEALGDNLSKDDINRIREIYLGEDKLIYVRYAVNGSEILLRLAPEGVEDSFQVIEQSEDVISGYRLQIVSPRTIPDLRGWEGLPNEEYTPSIRKALGLDENGNFIENAPRNFVCVKYNVQTQQFEIARFRYDNGAELYGGLPPPDLGILNDVINRLDPIDIEFLKPSQIIFMRGQSGHYGISRNQYYLDIDLLNDPVLFKTKLHHEITERMAIITHPEYVEWRKNRKETKTKAKIFETASKEHERLVLEEMTVNKKEARNVIKGLLKLPGNKGPDAVEKYRKRGLRWEDLCSSTGNISFNWTHNKRIQRAFLSTGIAKKGPVVIELYWDEGLMCYVFKTKREVDGKPIISYSRFEWDEKKGHWGIKSDPYGDIIDEMLQMPKNKGPDTVEKYKKRGLKWEDVCVSEGAISFIWTHNKEVQHVHLFTGIAKKGPVVIELYWDEGLGCYVFKTRREIDGEIIISYSRFEWDEKKGHWGIKSDPYGDIIDEMLQMPKNKGPDTVEKYKKRGLRWEDLCSSIGQISFNWTHNKRFQRAFLSTGIAKKGPVVIELYWDEGLGCYVFKTKREVDDEIIISYSRFEWDERKGHWDIKSDLYGDIIDEMLQMPKDKGPDTVEKYRKRGIRWEDVGDSTGKIFFGWKNDMGNQEVYLRTGRGNKGPAMIELYWDEVLGCYVFKTRREVDGKLIISYSRFEWDEDKGHWVIHKIRPYQLYKDKKSVEAAFKKRKLKGLDNTLRALRLGKEPGLELLEAARNFGVPLDIDYLLGWGLLDEEFNRESEIASIKKAGELPFNKVKLKKVVRMLKALIKGKKQELEDPKKKLKIDTRLIIEQQIKILEDILKRLEEGGEIPTVLLELLGLRAPDVINDSDLEYKVDFINEGIGEDVYQSAMVRLCLSGKSRVVLVQGGPGSGKSTALAETICQLVKRGKKILLVAHDNSAVNTILEKLDRLGIPILRATKARDKDELEKEERISPPIKKYSIRAPVKGKFEPEFSDEGKAEFKKRQMKYSGMVLGVTADTAVINRAVREFPADIVTIDEAGLCDAVDTIVAGKKAKEKLIIVGDHKQLPPYFREEEYIGYDEKYKELLKKSYLAACWDMGFSRVFLARNYRSHPAIAYLVGWLFYDRLMVPKPWTFMEKDTIRVVDVPREGEEPNEQEVYGLAGIDYGTEKDKDYQNMKETEQCIKEFERAIKSGYPAGEITIITPYNGQVENIKLFLKNYLKDKGVPIKGYKNIEEYLDEHVLTINKAYGRENRVVIISFVRSNPKPHRVGFYGRLEFLNVALSRPMDRLVIIGDKETLSKASREEGDRIFSGKFSQIDGILKEFESIEKPIEEEMGRFTIHEAIQEVNGHVDLKEKRAQCKVGVDTSVLRQMENIFLEIDSREYNEVYPLLEVLHESAIDSVWRGKEPEYDVEEAEYDLFVNRLDRIAKTYPEIIKMDIDGAIDLLWLKDDKNNPVRIDIVRKMAVTVAGSDDSAKKDSRGWEGLPNEEYTPGIRKALGLDEDAQRNFVCVEYNGKTQQFEVAKFRYDNGKELYGDLSPPDLGALNDVINRLDPIDIEFLRPSQIIFMPGQSGHYGISRNQYYLDINLLNNPDLLRAKLHHEIQERMAVVTHPRYIYWKNNRGKPETQKAIQDVAYMKHVELLNEAILMAFNVLEEFVKSVARENRHLETNWSNIGALVQNIGSTSRLQFAVPMGVLRSSPDMAIALKRIGLFGMDGRGDRRVFELIIYDVKDEIEAENVKDLIGNIISADAKGRTVKIYTITKQKISERNNGDYPLDILHKTRIVKDIIKADYPIKGDEYLAIASDTVDEQYARDILQTQLGYMLEKNISFEIVVKPNTGSTILLSSILYNWLNNLSEDITSFVNIALPAIISPEGLWKQLEDLNNNAWRFLSAA